MPTRQVNIPTIGTKLTLAKDWTFSLLAEHRNGKMMDYLEAEGIVPPDAPHYVPALCRASIVMSVRRIKRDAPMRGTWLTGPYTEADYEMVDVPRHCGLELGHEGACDANRHVQQEPARYECTIPAGLTLIVDRIYIRRGSSGFDSLTFWVGGLAKKKVRFFAKLADVNRIVVSDGPVRVRRRTAAPPVLRAILLRE